MGRRRRHEGKSKTQSKQTRASMTPEQVQAELMEGVTVDTLIALGVLTPRGGASPSARRKVKQVNHLLNQLNSALSDLFKRYENPVIIDMGAGRATASLALYDRWIRTHDRGRLIAIESRKELVDKVRNTTREQYPRLEIIEGEALTAPLPDRLHLVLGLHACDLATDHAIARAITGRADYVALVPCCQAEFARALKTAQTQLKDQESNHSCALSTLWGSNHHRREFGAHLTNVCRSLVLRAVGYTVNVTELTGWEHSMKNELIIGRRVGRFHRGAHKDLRALLGQLGLADDHGETLQPLEQTPWLIRELQQLITARDQIAEESHKEST